MPALPPVQGEIKHSKTGGDVWAYEEAPAHAAGGGGESRAPPAATLATSGSPLPAAQAIKCNAWDVKGRNPGMNVWVELASGCADSGDDGAPRCKLGVLVSHALPQLAARLGGFSALALDWVTWAADADSREPDVASVAAFGTQDAEHWRLLHELVRPRAHACAGVGWPH